MIYYIIDFILQVKKPSIWLKVLSFFGLLPFELKNLKKTPQSFEQHPEGNVFVHSCLAIDQAAKWKHEIPEDWRRAFMWGMLYHDVGKYVKTDRNSFRSYEHDRVGGYIAEYFLIKYFEHSKDVLDKIVAIIQNHMAPQDLENLDVSSLFGI